MGDLIIMESLSIANTFCPGLLGARLEIIELLKASKKMTMFSINNLDPSITIYAN